MSTVLVTGGSGFIAGFCIVQLLEQGHSVRATVRNLSREGEVRATLAANGVPAHAPLTFFAANLESDAGWAQAAAGCDYVLHVASPFPAAPPKYEDELIVPAREGALRVLDLTQATGLISWPSFHTAGASLVVWSLRKTWSGSARKWRGSHVTGRPVDGLWQTAGSSESQAR